VVARVPVTPGQQLTVDVGVGAGYVPVGYQASRTRLATVSPGAYGGGGAPNGEGAGGGGSFVFRGAQVLVAAGGGGGGAASSEMMAGGLGGDGGGGGPGHAGYPSGTGGGAGTRTGPGAGGVGPCPQCIGGAGTGPALGPDTFGQGGDGRCGGAGGGGVFGGGGGGCDEFTTAEGGGGGGSGALAPGVVALKRGTNQGDGIVQISWLKPIATTITMTVSPASVGASRPITVQARVRPAPDRAAPGTVVFRAGGAVLCSAPVNSRGVASCTIPASASLGTESIIAAYSGSGDYTAATSVPVSVTVHLAAPAADQADPAAQLANTGTSSATPLTLAIAAMLGGLLLMVGGRHRRRQPGGR
jgi:LPXTG-motif cell wall-anchored protein